MPTFAKRLLVFAIVQLATLGALASRYPGAGQSYWASTLDKHARAAAVASPRLILAGGSNVAFGADSVVLEDAFGIPVVNMGLAAGAGLDFILNETRDLIRRGDTVVLSPEYSHLLRDQTLGTSLQMILEARPASATYLAPAQWKRMLDRGLTMIHNAVALAVRGRWDHDHGRWGAYWRGAIDERGDMIGHHGRPSLYAGLKFGGARQSNAPLDTAHAEAVADAIDGFAADAEATGARVFFAHPGMSDIAFWQEERQITAALEILGDRLEHATVLGAPRESLYPKEEIFDLPYHLTEKGKAKRTALLVADLRPFMDPARPRERRP